MARSSLMMLLLVVALIALTKNEDSACPDTVLCDKAVYENESVKFTICTAEQGHKYFTYNGTPISQLDDSEDFVEGRENSCYFLTFLALQANDNAIISFKDFNGEDIDSAVLHVQGVLKAPEYFYWHGANSTHLTLVWSAPYSLFDEEYELVIRRNNEEMQRLYLTALDYTMFRPYNTVVIAELTPFNPVGRGELSTLNLTDSLFYCGSTDEITADSQSFFEAGQVSVLMQLFLNSNRNYCLGLSDEVEVKHSLLPDDITSSLRVVDGKIVITLHHLPFAKHLRDVTIILGSIELNLNISTYKVENASLSDDKKTVQCYFLSGSSHNACFIVVLEDGGKAKNTLSGSDRYQLDSNTPGTFTLMIYDDMRQRDAGIEPALEITFSIDDRDSNSETDLGLVLGVPLSLLLLIVGIVVVVVIAVRCNKTEAAAAIYHPEDDDEHKTSSFVCGIEYESTRNPLHLGPSHALIRQDCLAPIRLVCTHTPALFRCTTSDQATIDDMEEGRAKSFPCGKSGIVKDSEKQADVVEGLPDTNLHPKPEETI